jgi:stage II sporulation protein D
VAAVLAVEALPPRPPHAGEAAYLRALAVVVRSYADYYRGRLARHAETGADLCDQTHCQAYRGIAGQLIHREAAAATAGIVLRKDGRLVPGYHSSTCAGRTALPAEAWGGAGFAGVYLNIDDVDADGRPLCAASPHLAWRFALPADELTEIVSRECFPLGRIEELEFEYGADERVARVRSPEGEVAGEAFRNAVCRVHGWGSLRSLAFHMRRERGMAVFTGRGLGHAVGFCQYGARALADRIHDWRQLLARYFPGLTTQR